MASDKFGANSMAPLYNATGRNPRDITPSATGQPLGSVGSSGSGGKNFNISNQAPQVGGGQNANFGIFSPYNYMSPFSRINTRQRINKMIGGNQPQSQPQGGGQPQGMSQTSSMSDDGTTQTNTLNNPDGAPFSFAPSMIGTDNSVQKNAYSAGPMTAEKINTGNSGKVGNETNTKQTQTLNVYEGDKPVNNTATRAPRAPRTDAQKAQRNATDRATRARNKENPPAVKPPAVKQNSRKPSAQQNSRGNTYSMVQNAPAAPAPGQ